MLPRSAPELKPAELVMLNATLVDSTRSPKPTIKVIAMAPTASRTASTIYRGRDEAVQILPIAMKEKGRY
jgi:hypothetical protein